MKGSSWKFHSRTRNTCKAQEQFLRDFIDLTNKTCIRRSNESKNCERHKKEILQEVMERTQKARNDYKFYLNKLEEIANDLIFFKERYLSKDTHWYHKSKCKICRNNKKGKSKPYYIAAP